MSTTPVLRLNELFFVRCDPEAVIGTFTATPATTDSCFQGPIKVNAIIRYGTAKIGEIQSQTLDFSNGPQKLEAHLFDVKEDLGHDGRELVARYLTTKSDVNIDVQNLNSTPALSFKVEAKGIGTLALTNVSARVQGKLLTGAADYSITIKHPIPIFKLEIIEATFVAVVGGDKLLEGDLKNFVIESGSPEGKTGNRPAKLCKNPLAALWDAAVHSKVDIEIRSANVKVDGLPLNGLQFNFEGVAFRIGGSVIKYLAAGLMNKFLS